MKNILLIFTLCIAVSANANIILKGSGKGSVSVTSMKGIKAGDTIGIRAGSYSGGGQFGGLNNITIINYGGVVTFTAPVDFGAHDADMNNIKWCGTGFSGNEYGFVFDASGTYGLGLVGYTTNGGFIFTARHYSYIRFNHIWFKGITANAFDLSGNLPTYDGTTVSLGLYKATFSYCRTDNTGEFYQGPYKTPNFGFADSIDISNNVFNQTSGNGMTVNSEMTNFNIHDNQILYSGYNAQPNDVGVFSLTGFGQIHHNYMKGGRGWLARISGCSFKPNISTFWGYNNIKIGSTTYGMFDMRTDTSWFAPTSNYFQHCNFNVVNNTFGNLTANDGNGTGTGNNYNTPAALFYILDGGATATVKNNLGFNSIAGNSGGYVCVSFAPTGFSQIDTSNNIYFPASDILDVLSDTNANCEVKSESPIISAGIALSNITTDYSARARANPPDIGAQEYTGKRSGIPPIRAIKKTKIEINKKLFFIIVSALCLLIAFFIRSAKIARNTSRSS